MRWAQLTPLDAKSREKPELPPCIFLRFCLLRHDIRRDNAHLADLPATALGASNASEHVFDGAALAEALDAIGDGDGAGMTASAALDVEAVPADHLEKCAVLHGRPAGLGGR